MKKFKAFYEKKTDMRVKVEENVLDYAIPPHFHNAVEFQYVLKGTFRIGIADKTVEVKRNHVLIIPSRITHEHERQTDVETIMTLIPYEFFAHFPVFQSNSVPFYRFGNTDFNRRSVLPLLRLLLRKYTACQDRENPFSPPIAIGWTNLIYGELLSFYRLNPVNAGAAPAYSLNTILDFIAQNYTDQELSLQSIAHTFGYNPSYLSRAFKKNFSVPLNQYIRSIRVKKFIELFPMQQTNILHFSLQCGFSSLSAFYCAFREETNLSPTQYFNRHAAPAADLSTAATLPGS